MTKPLFHSRSLQNPEYRNFPGLKILRNLALLQDWPCLPSLPKSHQTVHCALNRPHFIPPCLCLCYSFCPQGSSSLSPSGDAQVGFLFSVTETNQPLELVAPSCLTTPPGTLIAAAASAPHPQGGQTGACFIGPSGKEESTWAQNPTNLGLTCIWILALQFISCVASSKSPNLFAPYFPYL